jgi:hypothetical protein
MQRIRKLFGGSGNSNAIEFSRFDPASKWTTEGNEFVAKEQITWLVDIMMIFISTTLLRTQPKLSTRMLTYTHHFYVDMEGKLENPVERGFVTTLNPTFRSYLVSFRDIEISALLWKERDTFEIFFPFVQKENAAFYMESIQKVIFELRTKWIKIHDPVIRVFAFPPSFFSSNIWVPYYACLRLVRTFEQVQSMFLNSLLQDELQRKAIFVYKNIGWNIAQCSKGSIPLKTAISLEGANFTVAAKQLNACRTDAAAVAWFDHIEPLSIVETQTTWPPNTPAKYKRFVPAANSQYPTFFFV